MNSTSLSFSSASVASSSSASSWTSPERSGSLRKWYDETNHVYRFKHGSDPTSESDGSIVVEG